MATTNSLGYNTYSVSTVKPILDCQRILLYNKYQFSTNKNYSKISLYNIKYITSLVYNSPLALLLTRQDNTSDFEYSYVNGKCEGFNTIIYLDASNNPLGYTEFANTQGKERNISLTINLTSTVDSNFSININNSLSSIRSNNAVKKIVTGSELWNYTTAKNIKDSAEKLVKETKFTTHLASVKREHSTDCLYLSKGFVHKSDNNLLELVKLSISLDEEVDPLHIGFTNFKVGYYKNHIALYCWVDEKFSILSLTVRNRFDNPIHITKTNSGYLTAPDKIVGFYGKYAKLISGDIYDTVTKNIINKDNKYNIVIDSLDPESNIYKIPQTTNSSEIINSIPVISNIFLDLEEYSKTNLINVVNKRGNWFILKKKLRTSDCLYLLVNELSNIYITEEELDKLIIVNDNTIMIESDNYYSMYFAKPKSITYSEKARVILEGGHLEFNKDLGIDFCYGGINDEEYLNKFMLRDIEIIDKSKTINKTILNNFRRNIYPYTEEAIPNIIDCCDGLFFYLTADKHINYL